MAYSTSNPPRRVAGSAGATGNIWIYKDGDPVGTVTGINYVHNAVELGMVAGDRVIHIDETLLVTTDLTVQTGQTAGTASGATTDTAGYAIGDSVITLASAGTGTLLIGDVVKIGSDPTEYTLTEGDTDVSGGGNMTVSPVLVQAIPASATAITVVTAANVLNLVQAASGVRVISGAGTTKTLTAAESGSVVLFDTAAGQTFTLPPAKAGLKYRFVTKTSQTGGAYAVLCSTASAGDFMIGCIIGGIENAATGEAFFANGTTHLGFSSNATTTGGLVGGIIDVEAITDVLWRVSGVVSCTATPATPFTT